jgi:hypothetical protein
VCANNQFDAEQIQFAPIIGDCFDVSDASVRLESASSPMNGVGIESEFGALNSGGTHEKICYSFFNREVTSLIILFRFRIRILWILDDVVQALERMVVSPPPSLIESARAFSLRLSSSSCDARLRSIRR